VGAVEGPTRRHRVDVVGGGISGRDGQEGLVTGGGALGILEVGGGGGPDVAVRHRSHQAHAVTLRRRRDVAVPVVGVGGDPRGHGGPRGTLSHRGLLPVGVVGRRGGVVGRVGPRYVAVGADHGRRLAIGVVRSGGL